MTKSLCTLRTFAVYFHTVGIDAGYNSYSEIGECFANINTAKKIFVFDFVRQPLNKLIEGKAGYPLAAVKSAYIQNGVFRIAQRKRKNAS